MLNSRGRGRLKHFHGKQKEKKRNLVPDICSLFLCLMDSIFLIEPRKKKAKKML